MSLRFRAGPADAEARAVFPAFGCPSGGLWYNSELEQPASTPHLVRCLRCASLNGQSALRCWSCEAELPAGLPLGEPSFIARYGTRNDAVTEPESNPDSAQPPDTPEADDVLVGADLAMAHDAVHAPPDRADASFSAPPSAAAIEERLAAFAQHRHRGPRRALGAAAIAAFTAVAAAGAYLIQRPPPAIALETIPAPRQAAGAVAWPRADAEPASARLAAPTGTEPPSVAGARPDAQPPADAEPAAPAPQAAAPPTVTPPSSTAALTAARTGNSGAARVTRSTRYATAPVPSVPIRGEPADTVRPRPSPTAQPRDCTATLAALGLCQAAAASTQAKE